jgi:bacterioferritin
MNEKHIRIGYSASIPYPEIKVSAQNKEYAQILDNDYAGKVSEMTAINQYMYHSFMSSNDELEKLFENTAIVEMYHLEILAKLIELLGGNPLYQNMDNQFWNGDYVYYGNNLCERLKGDLNSEYKAIENYKKDIEIIKDPYIQVILKRIILDEEVHVELFQYSIEKNKCDKA